MCAKVGKSRCIFLILLLASLVYALHLTDFLPDLFGYEQEVLDASVSNYVETTLQDGWVSSVLSMLAQEEEDSGIAWSYVLTLSAVALVLGLTAYPSFDSQFLVLIGVYYGTKYVYYLCFGPFAILENYYQYFVLLMTMRKRFGRNLHGNYHSVYPQFLSWQLMFLTLKALMWLGSFVHMSKLEVLGFLFWEVAGTVGKYILLFILFYGSGAAMYLVIIESNLAIPEMLPAEKDAVYSRGLKCFFLIASIFAILLGVQFSEYLFYLCSGEVPWLLAAWFYILATAACAFPMFFSWNEHSKDVDVFLSDSLAILMSIGIYHLGASLIS